MKHKSRNTEPMSYISRPGKLVVRDDQLGTGVSRLRTSSDGFSNLSMEAYMLTKRSTDGIMSKFSHPSGKPTSAKAS
uniref:Uncharacterized protein n=1 Tax=Helianthus annuus TaxID=4232 RepID=A0A251U9I7_HELAN